MKINFIVYLFNDGLFYELRRYFKLFYLEKMLSQRLEFGDGDGRARQEFTIGSWGKGCFLQQLQLP
jgi:hypothetical protein